MVSDMSSKGIAIRMFKGHVSFTIEVLRLLSQGKSLESLPWSRAQIRRKLKDLEKEGLIKEKSGHVVLTRRGRDVLSEERIWALTIPSQKKWDHRWRMVLYDIPVAKNFRRHVFRAKLREMGLVLYQNSVWVYPYPVEEIVSVIADFYGLRDYVLFAVAERLHGEGELRKVFGLS